MGLFIGLTGIDQHQFDEIIQGNQELLAEILEDEQLEDQFNLDRTWDAINYILEKSNVSSPFKTFIKSGGKSFDNSSDIFIDGIRIFSGEEVREISHALHVVSTEEFRCHFDANEMNSKKLYPGNFDRVDSPPENQPWVAISTISVLDGLCSDFEAIKAFIEEICKRNKALIVFYF